MLPLVHGPGAEIFKIRWKNGFHASPPKKNMLGAVNFLTISLLEIIDLGTFEPPKPNNVNVNKNVLGWLSP